MNTQEIKPYIFISYSHADAAVAQKISSFLREEGFDVWIDYEGIRAGEKFNDKIAMAIYNSSLFISLVSESYMTKPFCAVEITYAHNHQKNCMPVYIEAVTPTPGHALDLIFTSTCQAGFNRGLKNENDFRSLCAEILESSYIQHLREYLGTDTGAVSMPYIRPSVLEGAESHYRKVTKGNYYLSSIEKELFPPFETESQLKYSDNNNALLISEITNNSRTSFLITGDGGSGKTIALRSIFRHFMNKGEPALYIPLNKIRFSENVTVMSYLKDELRMDWDVLKAYAAGKPSDAPLRLLFDGVNEIHGERKSVLKEISESFMRLDNAQVIISSRTDFSNFLSQDLDFRKISLRPLSCAVVEGFLEKKNITVNPGSKMLLLLTNPLMLTLYFNTDTGMYKPLSKYSSYYKTEVSSDPSSEAQIIWNFLQSQLYRVDEGFSGAYVCDAFMTIEYLLPLLANHMVTCGNKRSISKEEFSELMREMPEREDYARYRSIRLSDGIEFILDIDNYEPRTQNLKKVLFNKLSLMVESDAGESYEFFHQCFRDFFAALFVAKKLELIASGKTNDFEEISRIPYETEILTYVAEVSRESLARPQYTDTGINYPGKKQPLLASEFSDAEKALNAFRKISGEAAQNAVYNAFTVMFLGRRGHLSNCDFSWLDMKKCRLKGGRYTAWFRDEQYPSTFENSCISLECFISPGHQSHIRAICEGNGGFFTADIDGTVKFWICSSSSPELTLTVPSGPVISMNWSARTGQLAILTQHVLYVYTVSDGTLTPFATTANTYRYVRFACDNTIEVTFDTAPMKWTDINGNSRCDYLDSDMPCGCSDVNPDHTEILRSQFSGNIRKYTTPDNTPVGGINLSRFADGKKINDIKFSPDGLTFLAAYSNHVLEFESETFGLLHSMKFASTVNSVLYTESGKIIVASGVNIVVLNRDFSYYREYPGESLPDIIKDFISNGNLYIFDKSGSIKLLSDKLTVQKIRKPGFRLNAMAFGVNKGEECIFAITNTTGLTDGKNKACVAYSFDKDSVRELAGDYEIFNVFCEDEHPIFEIYRLNNRIIAIDKKSGKSTLFNNYKGITIHGCNFRNVSGSIAQEEGISLIIQNGGIIDEHYTL